MDAHSVAAAHTIGATEHGAAQIDEALAATGFPQPAATGHCSHRLSTTMRMHQVTISFVQPVLAKLGASKRS